MANHPATLLATPGVVVCGSHAHQAATSRAGALQPPPSSASTSAQQPQPPPTPPQPQRPQQQGQQCREPEEEGEIVFDIPVSTSPSAASTLAYSPHITTMTSSSLSSSTVPAVDLLFLTFNCGKKGINVPVFANHLHTAFGKNASSLPDLIVFSLQEIAPLSYCFIGGYFLTPYLTRFEQAANLAATRFLDEHRSPGQQLRDEEQGRQLPDIAGPDKPYTVIRAKNVGYTGIILLARNPDRLRRIQEAEVGFGAADMGNKGAVGLRMLYRGDEGQETELTFVATHLAAMEWNLHRRNANWATIMRGLAFENPEDIVASFRKAAAESDRPSHSGSYSGSSSASVSSERVHLLNDEHEERQRMLQQKLQDISVFRPSSHLFVGGDLNYRISASSPPPDAAFPSLDPESPDYYPDFFRLDQLTRERHAGRTLHGLTEHKVTFPPTYKYKVLPRISGVPEMDDAVPWEFASHRYPSWTDRILYLDIPSWLETPARLKVRAYDALPVIRTSDHRPVFLRATVPLLEPAKLAPPSTMLALGRTADPRVKLPVEMDPEAWERRAAARRREVMVGWGMFLWSTKEGAWILAVAMVVGAGAYWYLSGRFGRAL